MLSKRTENARSYAQKYHIKPSWWTKNLPPKTPLTQNQLDGDIKSISYIPVGVFPESANTQWCTKVAFELKCLVIIQIKSTQGRREEQSEEACCCKSWSPTSVIAWAIVE